MKKLSLLFLIFTLAFLSVGAYQDFQAAKSADIEYGYIPIYITLEKFNGGAKGDGVTDDTKAIQMAISFAEEVGAHSVLFPAGRYVVIDYLDFGSLSLDAVVNTLVAIKLAEGE